MNQFIYFLGKLNLFSPSEPLRLTILGVRKKNIKTRFYDQAFLLLV
jgi:hypothetical protein